MASKARLRGSTGPKQPGIETEERDRSLHPSREQEIRRRAYDIYLERGAQAGRELEDWLQAERELESNPPTYR